MCATCAAPRVDVRAADAGERSAPTLSSSLPLSLSPSLSLAWLVGWSGGGDAFSTAMGHVDKAKKEVAAAVPKPLQSAARIDQCIDDVHKEQLTTFADLADLHFETLLSTHGKAPASTATPGAHRLTGVADPDALLLAELIPKLEDACPAVTRAVRAETLERQGTTAARCTSLRADEQRKCRVRCLLTLAQQRVKSQARMAHFASHVARPHKAHQATDLHPTVLAWIHGRSLRPPHVQDRPERQDVRGDVRLRPQELDADVRR